MSERTFDYLEYEPDPADAADELAERSESIDLARDAAFERGRDEFEPDGDVELGARRFAPSERLMQDYRDGWQASADEATDDEVQS